MKKIDDIVQAFEGTYTKGVGRRVEVMPPWAISVTLEPTGFTVRRYLKGSLMHTIDAAHYTAMLGIVREQAELIEEAVQDYDERRAARFDKYLEKEAN